MTAALALDRSVLPPQIAGRFYPATAEATRAALEAAFAKRRVVDGLSPKLIVAPHAGLPFSGPVAASAFTTLTARRASIRRVVVIGPCHVHRIEGLAIPAAEGLATPLGVAWIAADAAEALSRLAFVARTDRPFHGEHAIEMHLPFLQHVLPGVEIVPILVGDARIEDVHSALDLVRGGPETVIAVSSDLSHFLAQEDARALDRETRGLVEALAGDRLDGRRACGHRPLAGALVLARAFDLRLTGIDLRTSADTQGHPERVVGYGAFAGEWAGGARLPDAERAALLSVAARALRHAAAAGGAMPKVEAAGPVSPHLTALRATFVTLEAGGRLAGCIGSLAPHRSLVVDVAANAVKAAFADPRFDTPSAETVEGFDLSVSILSHPRAKPKLSEAQLAAALAPDVEGLILKDGERAALFLPSVWKSLTDPRDFLRALKRKAGLPADHWSDTVEARTFRVESFGAPLAAIDPDAAASIRIA